MPNDGQIVFEVTADGKHAIADIKDITRAIKEETAKWDDAAGQATNNINDNFSGMLKKLATGITAAKIGKALVDIGKEALAAASDLEEVQNVVDVTFGSGASKIDAWAKAAGSQFGLTETQAKKFTSTLGAMMKSSGMAGSEIVDMSTNLAGLAADMASFYNLDFETSFQKIRSGLSGETEPLKQLGINMSVANLEAFALQQGLSKTFNEMTQGEQTMLRYQYIMQATADAQGDFSRTSDGYANSMRKLQTNIDKIKTTLGKSFIDVVSDATGFLNGFIEMLTPEEKKSTVLDEFASIDLQTEAKLADIGRIKEEAQTTADLLDKIYGQGDTGTEAADKIAQYGAKSEEATKYLAGLGLTTDEITEKQETWLETCKRLVKTIPGLSEIINTETGEVKGGRAAIQEYINAWSDGQKKLALLRAQAQKKQALENKYAELPGLEVDKMLWDSRLKKAEDQLRQYYKDLGVTAQSAARWWNGREFGHVGEIQASELGLSSEEAKKLNAEYAYYNAVKKNAQDATSAYQEQYDAYQEGVRVIEEADRVIEETYGATEQAAEAAQDWDDSMKQAGETAVSVANEAITALADYVKGVRDSVATSIDTTVKGFEYIGDAAHRQSQRLEPLEKELETLKEDGKDLGNINLRIANAQDMFGIGNLKKNLDSQLAFLKEYKQDMQKAQEMGFSNEFLAQFADGSVESAEWLHELVGASDGQVEELNKLYSEVEKGKSELTDTLTQQQLSVDDTYKALAEKAKEAVAALDLQNEAAENTGKTVEGIATGIKDHVDSVAEQVDAIIAQLNRLDGFGINIDFGGFGSISWKTSTGKEADASGRFGLDYVPRDDYLIRAHEGERLLTAQENQVWNMLLNGGVSGIDLDSLGGVMRDNIKAGGNVYLDGRAVGAVVSDRQGKSYKSLQRSGWQS